MACADSMWASRMALRMDGVGKGNFYSPPILLLSRYMGRRNVHEYQGGRCLVVQEYSFLFHLRGETVFPCSLALGSAVLLASSVG